MHKGTLPLFPIPALFVPVTDGPEELVRVLKLPAPNLNFLQTDVKGQQ